MKRGFFKAVVVVLDGIAGAFQWCANQTRDIADHFHNEHVSYF